MGGAGRRAQGQRWEGDATVTVLPGAHPRQPGPVCLSSDPMLELAGTNPSELDGQQELDDYEENTYDYEVVGNPTGGPALAEQTMKEIAYYNML